MTENIISQTTITFTLLHRSDEPVTTLEEALDRATHGHAVGSLDPDRVTVPVPNAEVSARLRELQNDGFFFEDDLAEADEDANEQAGAKEDDDANDADADADVVDFTVTAENFADAEDKEDRATLAVGLTYALTFLGEPTHPDLQSISERAHAAGVRLAPTNFPLADVLAVYDDLTAALVAFSEGACEAAVERDRLAAQVGHVNEVENPYAAYGAQDWANASKALEELNKARTQATGRLPIGMTFSMYTDAADAAVFAAIDALAVTIYTGDLSPSQVSQAIKDTVKQIAAQYPEVHDTEPEWDIVDALNPVLKRRGYAEISRDSLD